jgi:hypothetical protein
MRCELHMAQRAHLFHIRYSKQEARHESYLIYAASIFCLLAMGWAAALFL